MSIGLKALALSCAAFLIAHATAGEIHAQSKKEPTKQAAPAPAKPPMPDATQLTLLTQNAMAALAQANMTGNYSVLYALSAPSFQQVNPPTKLAEIFASLRKNNIDITPVILYQPVLLAKPAIDDKGILRLTGFYGTQPQNVMFDLLYVPYRGQWRLQGISVRTRPAQQAKQQAPAKGAPPPPAKSQTKQK